MPRQSQNQSPAPSRKKALLSVAILLALPGSFCCSRITGPRSPPRWPSFPSDR